MFSEENFYFKKKKNNFLNKTRDTQRMTNQDTKGDFQLKKLKKS